jgi:hypothetical protein
VVVVVGGVVGIGVVGIVPVLVVLQLLFPLEISSDKRERGREAYQAV